MAMTDTLRNHQQGIIRPVPRQKLEGLSGTALQEMSDLYLDSLDCNGLLSKATKRAYQTDLRQFIAYVADIGIGQPGDVKDYHLDDWVLTLTGQAASTVRRKLVAISQFFEWMMKREMVARNPVDLVKKPKKTRGYGTAVTLDHYRKLLAVCSTSRERALLATLFWGGCRRQEVIDLNIGHVDLTQSILTVRGKGEKVRRIAIPGNLQVHLKNHLAEQQAASPGDPLFLNRDGRRLSAKSVNSWFRKICRNAGLADLNYTPHSCRRGIANVFDFEGFSMFAIQNFLGHEDPKTTSLYVTDAGQTLLVKMQANPTFNDEAEEQLPQDRISQLEGTLRELTSVVNDLKNIFLPPEEEGFYSLHQPRKPGSGIGHGKDVVTHK
jgi:site-specific recombinase XerD